MDKIEDGIVIKSTGSWFEVRKSNGDFISCRLKGNFRQKNIKTTNPVAVGDEVKVVHEDEKTGLIVEIGKRKNYIIRKSVNLSKREHILAANIDQAVLFVTLKHPTTYTGFIDRFLVTAEAYHIPAILIFNKVDLYEKKEHDNLSALKTLYEKLGYDCYLCNSTMESDVQKLSNLFLNKVSLLSGHSGAGKTTFINSLEPGLNLKTSEISSTHLSGKHTTTFAEMIALSENTYIIDSPGIKGLGVIDIPSDTLAQYFPEFRELMSECKFHNCKHIHEPGCAVIKGIENEEIASSRYKSYLSILEDESGEHYRTVDY